MTTMVPPSPEALEAHRVARGAWAEKIAAGEDSRMTTPIISNEYAAELVATMRATIANRDETTATEPPDPRDLLIVKLYDDLQALAQSVAFLGGGIKPVTKVAG